MRSCTSFATSRCLIGQVLRATSGVLDAAGLAADWRDSSSRRRAFSIWSSRRGGGRSLSLSLLRRRAPHLIRRFLQATRALRHLGRALLASQALELPRQAIRLVCQLTLASTATAAATWLLHLVRTLASALILLLLAGREFLELLQRLVDLLLLPVAARHAEPARTGSASCRSRARTDRRDPRRSTAATAAATTAATAHAHLHVAVDRFGALQHLQRALLRRQRILRVALGELLLGSLHFV